MALHCSTHHLWQKHPRPKRLLGRNATSQLLMKRSGTGAAHMLGLQAGPAEFGRSRPDFTASGSNVAGMGPTSVDFGRIRATCVHIVDQRRPTSAALTRKRSNAGRFDHHLPWPTIIAPESAEFVPNWATSGPISTAFCPSSAIGRHSTFGPTSAKFCQDFPGFGRKWADLGRFGLDLARDLGQLRPELAQHRPTLS